LSEEKNCGEMLVAFSRLAQRHPDWDLVVLGEGPERAALESARDALGLRGRAFLPGRAGNVGEWYARAELFVSSSRFEGFPNSLVEAMAYGVPAVSFDCDTGPRDIIRHDVDGLLVRPGDTAALTAALDRVLSDPALRARLAARASDARTRFSMDRIAREWEELFVELSR
jgi:glycosyltransferase involved in cell wall biosynthesis